MTKPPLLVFTDLDGTLLDHDTYCWKAAQPALTTLKDIGAGLILASSKTATEIRAIQSDLGITDWPAIVENGAGLTTDAVRDTTEYEQIRDSLSGAPHRMYFQGFADMIAEQITDCTGLQPADAARAKLRAFSEPGVWHGSTSQRTVFLTYLATRGISAREGGRFLTLSLGKTKADQMADIIARYKPAETIALGDAPNDVEMLQKADRGVIVANPYRKPLPTLPQEASGQIIRTTAPGPVGWNAAILDHIAHLTDGRLHG